MLMFIYGALSGAVVTAIIIWISAHYEAKRVIKRHNEKVRHERSIRPPHRQ